MAYEPKDASYGEYVKACESEGVQPVPRDKYTFQFWLKWCAQRRYENAVYDADGRPWIDPATQAPSRKLLARWNARESA